MCKKKAPTNHQQQTGDLTNTIFYPSQMKALGKISPNRTTQRDRVPCWDVDFVEGVCCCVPGCGLVSVCGAQRGAKCLSGERFVRFPSLLKKPIRAALWSVRFHQFE